MYSCFGRKRMIRLSGSVLRRIGCGTNRWMFLFLGFLAIVAVSGARVNLADYAFNQTIGVYQEISGGIVFGNSTTDEQKFVSPSSPLGGTAPTGEGIPIGFDFIFSGITYNRFAISANGWIALGQSALSPAVNMSSTDYFHPLASIPAPDTGVLIARIAAFAQDLQAQTGASIRVETIGEAPDRICVIQWKKYRFYNTTGSDFNFQIRLYETTNQVRIVYGSFAYSAENRFVQVGLRGAPASVATNFNLRESSSGSSDAWENTSAGLTPNATVRFRSTTRPPAGLAFVFSPVSSSSVPAPVTDLSINRTPDGLVLQWGAAENADLYWIYSTDEPFDGEWDFEAAVTETFWTIPLVSRNNFFRIISVNLGR